MKKFKKIASIFFMILVIINLILFPLKMISSSTFWLTIILAAVYAFLIMPRIK